MACFVSSDGDLGFHLATGREILATGRIPSTNVLSFTESAHAWRLHQGLPAVLFELLFRRWDIQGVIALKMAVVGVTWGVVYLAARRLGASVWGAAFACVLAAMAGSFRFEARPYLFTHLTLALTLLGLASYLADARRGTRALAAMALVFAAAAQLHAGALDSLIVMLIAAVGCIVQPLHERVLGAEPSAFRGGIHAARLVLASAAGVALAALALASYHPIGPAILLFPFEMGADPYLAEHLVEFRSPIRFPITLVLMFWVWLGLVALTLVLRARTLHAAWLGCLLVYALLSLRFARMAYALAIVSAPIVAAAFSRAPVPLFARLRPSLRGLLLGCALLAAPLYVFRDHTPGFGYSPRVWPREHFRFVREQSVRGPAFVSNAWAGPWLGTFYPERKSFFDTRLEAYSPEFLRDVYQAIAYGKPGWDDQLERHGIELLLLRYTTPGEASLQRGAPNLRQKLVEDPRFALLRFDDVGELFVRKAGPNRALAERFALPGIDPDRRRFLGRPRDSAAPLLAAMERGERSITALVMTALAVADAGQLTLARSLCEEARRLAPDDAWAERVQTAIAQHQAAQER